MSDYHHGDLANALLNAARLVLKEKGLHGLSLRACAMKAGVSHSAPAHHFKSLKGLLTELAIIAYDEFTDELKSRFESVSDQAEQFRMQEVGQAYIEFSTKQPELFKLMFSNAYLDLDNPRLQESSAKAYQQLQGIVHPLFDLKKMDESQREHAEILIWSIVHGYAYLLQQKGCADKEAVKLPDIGILGELLS